MNHLGTLRWALLAAVTMLGPSVAFGQCTTPRCSVTIPGTQVSASISRNDLGNMSMRLEVRLHGQNWAATSNVGSILSVAGLGLAYLGGNGIPNAVFYSGPDTAATGNCIVPIAGATDILARVSRDLVNREVRLEVNRTDTGKSYGTCVVPITALASSSAVKGAGVHLGSANATGSIAFMRWYSSTVPMGTPIPASGTTGNLGNWEFQQSGADSSGAGQNLGGLSGYSNTQSYVPACFAGKQQVVRTGATLSLEGGNSFALDGGPGLTYAWTVISSPASVSIANSNSAAPTVTGLTAFGTYQFELTVTDSNSQATACRVKHGAVIADSDGVVDLSAEGLSETGRKLMGPSTIWGQSLWPWADDRQKASLDLQIQNLATTYTPYWRTPRPGTIEITAGTNVLTGVGTDLTEPCGGGTTPLNSAAIIVTYPGTDGRTHYTSVPVVSCTDATHIVVSWQNGVGNYAASPLVPFPNCTTTCTGLPWQWGTAEAGHGVQSQFGNWAFNSAPGNYYDNAKAFYILYYRTGIDDYLTAAQNLAETWWEHPFMDQGYGCYTFAQNNTICWPYRSMSLTGVLLRALEEGPTSPKWVGLRVIWERSKFLLGNLPTVNSAVDAREHGYYLAFVSYCAFADPDTAQRNSCKTAVRNTLSTVWVPFKRADLGGGWGNYFSLSGAGTSSAGLGGSGSVCVSNGSTGVTGTGTSWTGGLNGSFWTFNAPATQMPATNAVGDPTYYTAVVNSPTTLTLERPYEGPTACNRGFAFGFQGFVGWGVSPWGMGHLGQAFGFAADAMEGFDGTARTQFQSLLHDAALWIASYGLNPGLGGLYNGAFFPGCDTFPIASTDVACYPANNAPTQTRTLATEVLRALAVDYQNTRDMRIHEAADLLMSQMFSKPGSAGPLTDGFYLSDYDDNGNFMTGTAPLGVAPKWAGELCGYTEGCSIWPAVRDHSVSLNSLRVRGKGGIQGGALRTNP